MLAGGGFDRGPSQTIRRRRERMNERTDQQTTSVDGGPPRGPRRPDAARLSLGRPGVRAVAVRGVVVVWVAAALWWGLFAIARDMCAVPMQMRIDGLTLGDEARRVRALDRVNPLFAGTYEVIRDHVPPRATVFCHVPDERCAGVFDWIRVLLWPRAITGLVAPPDAAGLAFLKTRPRPAEPLFFARPASRQGIDLTGVTQVVVVENGVELLQYTGG